MHTTYTYQRRIDEKATNVTSNEELYFAHFRILADLMHEWVFTIGVRTLRTLR